MSPALSEGPCRQQLPAGSMAPGSCPYSTLRPRYAPDPPPVFPRTHPPTLPPTGDPPAGPRTLCNACGVKRTRKLRAEQEGAKRRKLSASPVPPKAFRLAAASYPGALGGGVRRTALAVCGSGACVFLGQCGWLVSAHVRWGTSLAASPFCFLRSLPHAASPHTFSHSHAHPGWAGPHPPPPQPPNPYPPQPPPPYPTHTRPAPHLLRAAEPARAASYASSLEFNYDALFHHYHHPQQAAAAHLLPLPLAGGRARPARRAAEEAAARTARFAATGEWAAAGSAEASPSASGSGDSLPSSDCPEEVSWAPTPGAAGLAPTLWAPPAPPLDLDSSAAVDLITLGLQQQQQRRQRDEEHVRQQQQRRCVSRAAPMPPPPALATSPAVSVGQSAAEAEQVGGGTGDPGCGCCLPASVWCFLYPYISWCVLCPRAPVMVPHLACPLLHPPLTLLAPLAPPPPVLCRPTTTSCCAWQPSGRMETLCPPPTPWPPSTSPPSPSCSPPTR